MSRAAIFLACLLASCAVVPKTVPRAARVVELASEPACSNLRVVGWDNATFEWIASWDPNQDPTVAGYRMYLRKDGETQKTMLDCGNVTEFSFFAPCLPRTFICLTAYNRFGLESPPTNEAVTPDRALRIEWDGSGPDFTVWRSEDLREWSAVWHTQSHAYIAPVEDGQQAGFFKVTAP